MTNLTTTQPLSQERIPRIIQDCLKRHEQQYDRLRERCLEARDPATPFILAMAWKVKEELREEMLRACSKA